MTLRRFSASLAALALLAACGGDDTAPPPANQPPSFANASYEIDYPENGTGTIITLSINDEAVANVVIALSGTDSNLFAIANGRDLVFNAPPDFENPQDSNGDNVYELTATATDAQGFSSSIDITVTVTDPVGATRFIDPVFDGTTTLGTVAMVTPSGNSAVAFTGPAGDTLMARPLVIVGGGQAPGAQAMATDFALRGYLVGMTDTQAPADLTAMAGAFGNGAFASLGIDAGAIAVAAPGDARTGSALQAAFAGSDVPTYTFAPDDTSAFGAAIQFHQALLEGRN